MRNGTIEKASSYFRNGYNCAESTLLAIAEDVLGIESDLIPKIATGFGGGISRLGYTCGAVSGVVMGFGLKYGRKDPEELRARTYKRVAEFHKRFRSRFGSIICKELSGCDLSTIEGVRKFREENVHEQKCSYFVNGAIEIFMNLINDKTEDPEAT
ncbi:MAG: C-GCAxxG-C-C family protein [Candidatus Bathyarchaeota archaeon]|jgi:C_GCAxxG_C_C family probable redox protein